jgi:hypothetical protein
MDSTVSKKPLHIFYSHSWITQIVIELIIIEKKINPDDVVILSGRNFKHAIDPSLKSKFIPCKKILLETWKQILYAPYQIYRFKKWFASIVKSRNFQLYVPHLVPTGLKLICSNKKCAALNYIEEGTLSYLKYQEIIDHLNSVNFHGRTKLTFVEILYNRLLGVNNFPSTYTSIYKLGHEAFPFEPKAEKLDIHKIIKNTPGPNGISHILVLAPFVDVYPYKMDITVYVEKMKLVLNRIKEMGVTKLHFKFHPSDSKQVRIETKKLLSLYEPVMSFIEVGEEDPLELIFLKYRPTVYSFNSSTAIYANQFGLPLFILTKLIDPNCCILEIASLNFKPYYLV